MKNLRTLGAALLLSLILALPAFAGHIHTSIQDPEPSPTPTATTSETDANDVAGHIHTGVSSTDSLTEVALSLLQSVLPLF